MPTYDYKCAKCAYEFELFQQMTDKPVKKCPQCGKNKAQRLIGCGSGIIFKGSGFYETDYKRKENKPESKTKASSEANVKKSDTGADAKANSTPPSTPKDSAKSG
ncbi:MAG: zinc ribbon domain-containing protein [Candidatus Omnitrophica bacterium]|nr:zinc ribbon domain-containing protein [Candidatus Omnitrophota bacterium]MBU4478774.1 zinc ribbon domain-containing protein [Candidatus Omnitrophota bacterium]MCG2704177.1 zinc ribbon domain-containing protein [Candidatus Omnitrophota bacterium]